MKVVKGDEMVGILICEFSRIVLYFLARSEEICVEVIGRMAVDDAVEWRFHDK